MFNCRRQQQGCVLSTDLCPMFLADFLSFTLQAVWQTLMRRPGADVFGRLKMLVVSPEPVASTPCGRWRGAPSKQRGTPPKTGKLSSNNNQTRQHCLGQKRIELTTLYRQLVAWGLLAVCASKGPINLITERGCIASRSKSMPWHA